MFCALVLILFWHGNILNTRREKSNKKQFHLLKQELLEDHKTLSDLNFMISSCLIDLIIASPRYEVYESWTGCSVVRSFPLALTYARNTSSPISWEKKRTPFVPAFYQLLAPEPLVCSLLALLSLPLSFRISLLCRTVWNSFHVLGKYNFLFKPDTANSALRNNL